MLNSVTFLETERIVPGLRAETRLRRCSGKSGETKANLVVLVNGPGAHSVRTKAPKFWLSTSFPLKR